MNVRRLCRHGLVLGLLLAVSKLSAQEPAAESEKFVGTFSNGVKIEFVGLANHPSAKSDWWRPDGTPLEERPYQNLPARMAPMPDEQAYEACWRWQALGDADVQTEYIVMPNARSSGHVKGKRNGTPAQTLDKAAFVIPAGNKTCNVRFTITTPATEWATSIDMQAGDSTSAGKFDPAIGAIGASFLPQHRDGTDTIVAVAYKIPEREVRLVAIDSKGVEYVAESS